MWTRLMYMNLPTALKPQNVKGKWHRPLLSGKYRSLLKNVFLRNNVPWIYDIENPDKKNPRHKQPKGKKFEFERPIRLAKIKKALEGNAAAEAKVRQEKLNARKISGIDMMLQKGLPGLLKLEKRAQEEQEAAPEKMYENLTIYPDERSSKGPKYSDLKKKMVRLPKFESQKIFCLDTILLERKEQYQ